MENSQVSSLTKNQLLLWTGQQLNPDTPLYNMVMTYEIKSAISIPHFKIAFQKLVEKSDAMRSVFELRDEQPVQKYLSTIQYEVEVKDMSQENDPKATFSIWSKQRATYQFDLEKCLFDCVLVKLSENQYIWYLNQHHLITDGWSTSLVFSKVSDFYAKAIQNDLNATQDIPSYQKFIDHAESVQKNEKSKEISEFWIEKQKKFPVDQIVPYHKKNTLLHTASERILIKLGKERTKKIQEFANDSGVRMWTLDLTLYNIFLTSLFAYIYRITNQDAIVIGSPTHNRTSRPFKQTIGFFVETFPLLAEIDEEETFNSLLKKVQIESNSFIMHAQTGLSTSEMNRQIHIFFNYINAVNKDFNGEAVCTDWVHPGHHDPRQYIRLHVHNFDSSNEIQLYFDLNTQVFDAQKQKEVPQHFLKILDAFIDNKNASIKDINLITESEVSRIKQWNNTARPYAAQETLLSKFKAQAEKTPDQIALIFEDTAITYKTFDEQSNQVANFLLKRNITTNDIVAVSMDRSLEMMIFIYGILKSGATYLPIDICIPEERLSFILKDSDAKAIFYNHDGISKAVLTSTTGFKVSTITEELTTLHTNAPQINPKPDDIAYVIYTSGSTGEPKGVECHHKGICNRLNWMQDDYPITKHDTLIQKTPITFDVSLIELFWPLQLGAKLVIETPGGHKDPERLIATIKKHKVTMIHFVPSMLNLFLEAKGIKDCTSIRKIFCSGEALSTTSVKRVFEQLDVELHNLYGPTEAAVEVTAWQCLKEVSNTRIPIGKPVANTHLYIVDKKLNLLPIGVPGELYLGGVQVAKGYLNRPDLTKKEFLKDTFTNTPNGMMYRTGDLARYREDGAVEYLGRIDHQVKLRGQRIELEEIEKTLEKYPTIQQAIVSLNTQNNLMVHYTGEIVELSKLIPFLKRHLPQYMIPSSFNHLEKFELLPSGKIDRKKLPKVISQIVIEDTIQRIAPQNEIEEIVHQVWRDVMKIEEIGIYENFISIGGNSLVAISITSRLKEMLELNVSINDVFNYPTIQSYAQNIEKVITQLLNEQE